MSENKIAQVVGRFGLETGLGPGRSRGLGRGLELSPGLGRGLDLSL
jgi:hypothetical protein